MQIDHDPNEPSRRALKMIGVLTAVIVLAAMVPVSMGIRWTASQLPIEVVGGFGLSVLMLGVGFHLGRWDARKALGLTIPISEWKLYVSPVARRLGFLALKSPIAVFLLPAASWRKATDEGEILYVRVMSVITGLVVGFAVSLAAWVIMAIPIIVLSGG